MDDERGDATSDDIDSLDETDDATSDDADSIDETDTVMPTEGPVVSENATKRGQWKVSRSPNLDQLTRATIAIILVTLVGVVVLLGAVIFIRDPNTDLGPYTANLVTPMTGLAGIAVGYLFGRRL